MIFFLVVFVCVITLFFSSVGELRFMTILMKLGIFFVINVCRRKCLRIGLWNLKCSMGTGVKDYLIDERGKYNSRVFLKLEVRLVLG